ncbi:MAG: hypothetical protein OHK0038_04380 [Flammeovirgaceae bacterium]
MAICAQKPVQINKGKTYTNKTSVSLSLSSPIAKVGKLEMLISNDFFFDNAEWKPYLPTVDWRISEGDGMKEVFVKFRNDREETEAFHDEIILDTQPPFKGEVEIGKGTYTTVYSVPITIKAKEASEMLISQKQDFAGARWIPFAETLNWEFEHRDGTQMLYVKFRDEAGNESEVVTDKVNVDTYPPQFESFNIEGKNIFLEASSGLKIRNRRDGKVDLAIYAKDAKYMMISNDESFYQVKWRMYEDFYEGWQLKGDTDGEYTVFIKFRDIAGNETAIFKDKIVIDTKSPYDASLKINEGARYTTQMNVNLRIFCRDANEMMVSESPKFEGSKWEAYKEKKNWLFEGEGEGRRFLYVKFRDKAKNESVIAESSIILDVIPPSETEILVNNGELKTEFPYVKAWVKARGATHMQISQVPNFSDSHWQIYDENDFILNFPNKQGAHVFYARFKDEAGNISNTITDTVILIAPPLAPTIKIEHDALYCSKPDRKVELQLHAKNAAFMQISEKLTFEDAEWEPYSTKKIFQLSENETNVPESEKTVFARFKSPTEVESQIVSDYIILDLKAPTDPFIELNYGKSSTPDPWIDVSLKAKEAHFMQVASTPDFKESPWVLYDEVPFRYNLDYHAGSQVVYARFKDLAGNISQTVFDTILLTEDPIPLYIKINRDNDFTNHPEKKVELEISASKATEMMISQNPNFEEGQWETYKENKIWEIQGEDGLKNIYVKFKSKTGNESQAISDYILLDRTPPQNLKMTLNGGALSTYESIVRVHLEAQGAAFMKVNDSPDFSHTRWEQYNPNVFTLSVPHHDDENFLHVYAILKDHAGNISDTVHQKILLEVRTREVSVIINDDVEFANAKNRQVILYNHALNAHEMMVSDNPDFIGAEWEPFKHNRTWTFEGEDGIKILYVKFRSITGEESDVYKDQIILDTTPPNDLKVFINEGDQTTLNEYVNVRVYAREAAFMKVSIFEDFRDTYWQRYSEAAFSLPLIPGGGYRKVYAVFRDLPGNESKVVSDSILLELPVVREFISIEDNAEFTKNPDRKVKLRLFAINAQEMMISENPTFEGAEWEKYMEHKYFYLSEPDGLKTVYVKYRSRTFTESKTASAQIILDREAPTNTTIIINQGEHITREPIVQVVVNGEDAAFMQVSERPDFKGALWKGYTKAATSIILSSGGGDKIIHARLRDRAGNVTPTIVSSIVLETVPVRGIVYIDDDKEYCNHPEGKVKLSLFAVHATEVAISQYPDFRNAEWQEYRTRIDWNLQGEDGLKNVYVKFRSFTQTESQICMDAIFWDRKPPYNCSIVLNGGSDISQSAFVKARLYAEEAEKMQVSIFEDFRDASSWKNYTNVPIDVVLANNNGKNKVYARFMDVAKNISPTVSSEITVEIKPIGGTVIIDQDKVYTNDPNKRVRLQLLAKNAKEMMISNYADFRDGKWMPFKSFVDWTLEGEEDGSKSVFVKFRSETKTESNPVSASIILDRHGPKSEGFTINDGATFTLSNQLEIKAVAEGAIEVQISMQPNFQDANWITYTGQPIKFATTSDAGKKTIYLRFRDISGNISPTYNKSILLEEKQTIGLLKIDGGKEFCTDKDGKVTLEFDSENYAEMMISDSDLFEGTNWEKFSKIKPWRLKGNEGQKFIYAKLKSKTGIESEVIKASIKWDKQPPTNCDITIDNGKKSTINPYVMVETKAEDAMFMRVANNPQFNNANWITYDPNPIKINVPFTAGRKTIYAQFKDQAGNTSEVVKKDILVELPPSSPSIQIDNGKDYCTDPSRNVVLQLFAQNVTEMMISNNEIFEGAVWEAYSAQKQWQLSENDGVKTVFAKFRNNSGAETKPKYDRIILDRQPPYNGSIKFGKSSISNVLYPHDISVIVSAQDAVEMQIDEDPQFSKSHWIPYSNIPFNYTLSMGDGVKVVYARFKDKTGNISESVSNSILLDTKKQIHHDDILIINNGNLFTNSENVFLNLESTTAKRVRIFNEAISFDDKGWQPYAPVMDWTLDGEDGEKIVHVEFEARDGAVSSTTAKIILDRQPPTNDDIKVREGKYCTNLDKTVTLELMAEGATKMLISNKPTLNDATWMKYEKVLENWRLEGEDGLKRIYVMYSDEAGNTTKPRYVEVLLDRTGPTDEFVMINEGELITNNPVVNLQLRANNVTEMVISNDGKFTVPLQATVSNKTSNRSKSSKNSQNKNQISEKPLPWIPFVEEYKWKLDDATDGEKTVYVKFRNESGIESTVITAKIILDKQPPVLESFAITPFNSTNSSHNAKLYIKARDARYMMLASDPLFTHAQWEPFFEEVKWEIKGFASRYVYLKLKDSAGNESQIAKVEMIFSDN